MMARPQSRRPKSGGDPETSTERNPQSSTTPPFGYQQAETACHQSLATTSEQALRIQKDEQKLMTTKNRRWTARITPLWAVDAIVISSGLMIGALTANQLALPAFELGLHGHAVAYAASAAACPLTLIIGVTALRRTAHHQPAQ